MNIFPASGAQIIDSNHEEFSACVVVGGEAPGANICNWKHGVCIAADSGVKTCAAIKLTPSVVLGDFDSVPADEARRIFPRARIITHSKHKNYSDAELALMYASEQGYTDITIIGGGGGDVEHFMDLLHMFVRPHAPRRIITKFQQIERIPAGACFEVRLRVSQRISFFAIGNTPARQVSSGLRWNLDTLELSPFKTSLRNIAENGPVHVSVRQGTLVAVWNHHDFAVRATSC